MHDRELTDVEAAPVGTARIDPSVEPFPRAVLTPVAAAPPADVAAAAISALPGHRFIVDDPALAAALISQGVMLVRASSLMVLRLPAPSPIPPGPGVELRPVQDTPFEYGEIVRRAYPPDHPDHELGDATPEGAAATIRGYLAGEIVGPLLTDASAEARLNGVLVGVNIVSDLPADDEYDGGPWITDLFVDPSAQGHGVGRALLGHALTQLTASGRDRLGLAVTAGNPARRLYEALGFVEQGTRWNLVNAT
ncbi:MAG: GNAT family N-acetyltransferase [Acidimicrobiales bacterium]